LDGIICQLHGAMVLLKKSPVAQVSSIEKISGQ